MRKKTKRGFAMVEIVLATAIVGGLAAAAMSLAASSAGQKARAANLARGRMLCRSLAEEIATRPVADWSSGALDISIGDGSFALKADSTAVRAVKGAGKRSSFVTIDEYDGYSESPPTDEDGNVLAGYTGWTRGVEIEVVRLGDPDLVQASETGLRKITVKVQYGDEQIAQTTFLRSSEWERIQP
ncbi:MAG: prepilin-type N-terminal cleavage/methylation domain-containing protein [Phycisphaera sp.]|nr:MAG: prepilin-type N-terminal cleavage/methylation domain-containing protein [Phycisphaera sp.]